MKQKMKVILRPPLTYYGGKQQLCTTILELIPEHDLYCEPFCGGAAVFFGKEPSKIEVINDTNREIINFYKVVKEDFPTIEKMVRISLHSRLQHNDAWIVFQNPHMFSEAKRAWAVWMLANQSVNSIITASWGYERTDNKVSKKITNKREAFTDDLAIRLQSVQIECADANYVIFSRDFEKAFFYVDPPYINSCQGHYDGYGEEDYEKLLRTLSSIKGKFLLSSFPSVILNKFIKEFGWHTRQIEMRCSASKLQKRKIEVLTANYPI